MWQFNHFSLQSIQNQSYFNFHILIAVTICLLGLVPIIRRFSNTFISEQKKPIYLISTVLIAGIIFILSMAEVIAGNFNPFIYFKF